MPSAIINSWKRALGMLLLAAAMLLWAAPTKAQVVPEAGLGLHFNLTDIMMDASFGLCHQDALFSVKLAFQTRLGTKRVLVESGTPNVLYQYQERRYLLGIEADKRFQLTELGSETQLGLFIGGFGGLTFNDYRGTDTKGTVGFGWEAMGGAYLSDPRIFILRLGYTYMPLPTFGVYPHRIGVSFNFVISDDI